MMKHYLKEVAVYVLLGGITAGRAELPAAGRAQGGGDHPAGPPAPPPPPPAP